MSMDPDTIAEELHARVGSASEVPFEEVKKILPARAVSSPKSYRWFLVPKFPTEVFGLTLAGMLDADPYEATKNKRRHDKIVALLEGGQPEWPAIVSADGIVLDGYHRIAAHDTMGHATMGALVAVKKRPSPSDESVINSAWHEAWNEAFP